MPRWVWTLLLILFVVWLLNINLGQFATNLITIINQIHHVNGGH